MRGLILLIAFISLGIAIFLLNKYTRPKKAKKEEEKVSDVKAEETTPEAEAIEEAVIESEETNDIDFDEVSMAETRRIDLEV